MQKGDAVRIIEQNGKLAAVQRQNPNGSQANKGEEATITNVDAKKGTVTVRMKDQNGKDVERTFTLAEDARYFDSTGRVAAVPDVFRSGNEVLVVEEQGKLKQMQQKENEKKPEGEE